MTNKQKTQTQQLNNTLNEYSPPLFINRQNVPRLQIYFSCLTISRKQPVSSELKQLLISSLIGTVESRPTGKMNWKIGRFSHSATLPPPSPNEISKRITREGAGVGGERRNRKRQDRRRGRILAYFQVQVTFPTEASTYSNTNSNIQNWPIGYENCYYQYVSARIQVKTTQINGRC